MQTFRYRELHNMNVPSLDGKLINEFPRKTGRRWEDYSEFQDCGMETKDQRSICPSYYNRLRPPPI